MIKDRFGRTISYMRISVTDRCNLRCGYCMPEGIRTIPMKELLTYEEIAFVCAQAAALGIDRYKVTGGEPLVRRDCTALVALLRKIPGVRQVTLTTNGVLLGEHLDELLKAGLDAVNISLDTLDRDQYRRITGADGLDAALAASGLLAPTAFFVAEQRARTPVPEAPGFDRLDVRHDGKTQISLFRRTVPTP